MPVLQEPSDRKSGLAFLIPSCPPVFPRSHSALCWGLPQGSRQRGEGSDHGAWVAVGQRWEAQLCAVRVAVRLY